MHLSKNSEMCNARRLQSDPTLTLLDTSKLKEFADDNFKFDGNGRNG